MVVFDATTLLLLLSPSISAPMDSTTRKPVTNARERIDGLIAELEKNNTKIIIPTPALSEILERAGSAGPQYLATLSGSSAFRIVPFDARAAVEVAAMTRSAIDAGDKRGGVDATWAKIKYDRQIVAIAKVEGASTIYSDDEGLRLLALHSGIRVIRIAELPLPPEAAQPGLFDPPSK